MGKVWDFFYKILVLAMKSYDFLKRSFLLLTNWSKLTSRNLGMEEVKVTVNLETADDNRTQRSISQWKK